MRGGLERGFVVNNVQVRVWYKSFKGRGRVVTLAE